MPYVKAHIAAIFAALVAVVTAVQQAGHLDRANVVQVGIAVLGVVLAYFIHNTDGKVLRYAQAIISSLVVAAQIVAPLVVQSGHITYAQCVVVGVTIVQAVAVYWARDNTAAPTVVNVTSVAGQHEAPEPGPALDGSGGV